MKANKRFIGLISVIVMSSFLFGTSVIAKPENNPFNQLWEAIFDLQTQVDEIEASSGATRYVYEGTIDLSPDGDIIKSVNHDEFTNNHHYALISIPQLELDDMPQVEVYVKLYDQTHVTDDLWRNADSIFVGSDHSVVVYDEESVLINYKMTNTLGTETYWINGEYMIVVIK